MKKWILTLLILIPLASQAGNSVDCNKIYELAESGYPLCGSESRTQPLAMTYFLELYQKTLKNCDQSSAGFTLESVNYSAYATNSTSSFSFGAPTETFEHKFIVCGVLKSRDQ